MAWSGPVRSGLVWSLQTDRPPSCSAPQDTSRPQLRSQPLGVFLHLWTFDSLRPLRLPAELSGGGGGFTARGGRRLWQDQQLRTARTQAEAGPASGRHVLTMSQRCPVLSVLVVRTLCYILVLYKWWSTCRASTPPQDHLMSRASTDGRNIPEVVRRSLCQQRRWLQRCFTPVYSGLDVVLFFKLFLNQEDFLQHFTSVFI